MSRAIIKINGVDGSNTNLPLNTLVSLDNDGDSSESTWTWSILDQPAGTADTLSATNIHNPTITPRKEGTYLLKLVVDAGMGSQHTDVQLFSILQLKSGYRIPAAQETIQADGTRGWATAVDAQLQALTNQVADPSIVVASAGGSLTVGSVAKLYGSTVIKSGLPGQETIPTATTALASDALSMLQPLGIVVGVVSSGGNATTGQLVQIRRAGLYVVPGTFANGTWAFGYPVYVSNSGALSPTPGTNTRRIGRVTSVVDTSSEVIQIEVEGSPPHARPLEFRADANAGSIALPTLMTIDTKYALFPMVIPANCAGSQGAGIAGTASVTCNINQNGTLVATVTLPTSGPATFTSVGGTPILISTGDKMELITPADTKGLTSVQASLMGS